MSPRELIEAVNLIHRAGVVNGQNKISFQDIFDDIDYFGDFKIIITELYRYKLIDFELEKPANRKYSR